MKNTNSIKQTKTLGVNVNSKARHREASSANKIKQLGAHLVLYPPEFSATQIDEIVAAAGGFPLPSEVEINQQKGLLAERLAELYQNLLMKRFWQSTDSASKARKQFATIERLASQLLKTLEIQDDDPLSMPFEVSALIYPAANRYALAVGGYPDFPPQDSSLRGREKCQQVVDGIILMRKWATDVKQHAQNVIDKHEDEGRAHHSGDEGLCEFFSGLKGVWIDWFSENPGMTFDPIEGKIKSPFFRFIKGIIAAMVENVTADMKECDPDLLKYLNLSDGAIRSRFRSTKKKSRVS